MLPIMLASFVLPVGILAVVLWFNRDALGGFFKAGKLLRSGTPAQAKLLAISETNTTINRMPVVAFTLEIHPQRGMAYQAQVKCPVPLLALSSLPRPGGFIPVRYDPNNPKSITVDFQALYAGGAPAASPAATQMNTPVVITEADSDRRWLFYVLGIVGLSILIFAGMIIPFAHYVVKQIGHTEFALAQLQRCPDAAQLLGEPIETPRFGRSRGVAKNAGGGFGYASWSMAVEGPKAKGVYNFNAEMHGGSWSLTGGWLKVGDKTINVLACLAENPRGK